VPLFSKLTNRVNDGIPEKGREIGKDVDTKEKFICLVLDMLRLKF
jgi:hypothetical protein